MQSAFILLITNARILRALAADALVGFQIEAEVLRIGVGGGLELNDKFVAVAFGKLGLADQHVALFLELDGLLAAFRFGDDGHDSTGRGDWFQRGIIERDGDGVVLRNLTPRQRNVGVYLGYKLSSKPGLVFTGITVAGTGIGGPSPPPPQAAITARHNPTRQPAL